MTPKDPFLRKADLHIHTPKSVCYSDSEVTPGDIVKAALDAGLEVIAVTDHNTAAGIDDVRAAAVNTGLYVFPGVELTTRFGHFLALFDTNTPVAGIDDFLDYAGIAKSGRGNAHTVSTDETMVILEKIHERDGLAVAAHIDRWPSGFMESSASRQQRREIHECEYLDALEITIPVERKEWENGEVRSYPRKHACIQGSDAHSPGEMARRPVFIRMETVGLEKLKEAFLDYENRIFFPKDIGE
jgi:PHP family Zn ribbon phosphoesterase